MHPSINSSQMGRSAAVPILAATCALFSALYAPIIASGHHLKPLPTTFEQLESTQSDSGADFNGMLDDSVAGNEITAKEREEEEEEVEAGKLDDESLVGLLAEAIRDPSSIVSQEQTFPLSSSSSLPSITTTPASLVPRETVEQEHQMRLGQLLDEAVKWSGESEQFLGRRMRETWQQIRKFFPPSQEEGCSGESNNSLDS